MIQFYVYNLGKQIQDYRDKISMQEVSIRVDLGILIIYLLIK